MKYLDKLDSVPPHVNSVALQKATEHPFSGKYLTATQDGTYLCRRCGLGLWETKAQFESHCGWPSFDERLPNAISEQVDADGLRVEIICSRCQSHLGHVFRNEGFTPKNQRDCVNSVMLDFVPYTGILDTEELIVAGGCFWGLDYWLKKQVGVLYTESGYIGGHTHYPTYEDVCSSQTGHYEAVRVVFDPKRTDCHLLYKAFFEIHDPTQVFGQGPDVGPQYKSAIFYYDSNQKEAAQSCIEKLTHKGYKVATQLIPMHIFWPAELYHQDYYQKHQKTPYCHLPTKRF